MLCDSPQGKASLYVDGNGGCSHKLIECEL